jgi:hypothetical protein
MNVKRTKQKPAPRTEAQKAERCQNREGQKVRQTKTKRTYAKNDGWNAATLGFKAGIKQIEFGPDFIVDQCVS